MTGFLTLTSRPLDQIDLELPAAVVVTPTPFVAAMFAAMMTPTIFAALFAPDPTTLLLANLVATMLIAPGLMIWVSIVSPDLRFRLRSPGQQGQ